MIQKELFDERERLFERLCEMPTLRQGFAAVKANGGSPGIDGVNVEEFEQRLDEELAHLRAELGGWSYKPRPVRRVEIPKPGGKGARLLGVPCIRDRVVQAGLKLLLEPLFDPYFSESSYGFRPGKNQRQAVEAAQRIVRSGKEHVVDIDLSRFFDRINQDRLLQQVKQRVDDKRIVRLIALTLRSGVMIEGTVLPTTEGTTQGSPLSPLLSNIVLDELDKELERRGHSFSRFADDCNIFVGSHKAAQRVMESVTKLIEKRMKLVVNREKSKVALAAEVKFLGMTIIAGTITIATVAMDRARETIKTLTPRRSHKTVEATIEDVSRWYRGWAGYFEMTQYPSQFVTLESHIRRRLRARLVRNMKRRRTIAEKIRTGGMSSSLAYRTAHSHRNWWALSHASAIERLYSNRWFEQQGLFVKSTEKQPHWFGPGRLIKIP
jgi:RNA-directed DNA polymerase